MRVRGWFPEREFIMRSEGHVRYLRITSRFQMTAAAIVAALLLAWIMTMAAVAIGSWLERRDALSLLNREAKVTSAESRIAAYRDDVDDVAGDLDRRQAFIERMDSRSWPRTASSCSSSQRCDVTVGSRRFTSMRSVCRGGTPRTS